MSIKLQPENLKGKADIRHIWEDNIITDLRHTKIKDWIKVALNEFQ
jgi:hypothetical protein